VSRTAAEFSKPVKRAALKRSGGVCEATGEWYGLQLGQRCAAPLSHGVEFDHIILLAVSEDSSLENCAAVCPRCHAFKTRKRDIPVAAKTKRQGDKANGIRSRGPAMPGSRRSPWKKKIGGGVERR
jgi:5-methylcytosine-specific restriction endonuclease McrA